QGERVLVLERDRLPAPTVSCPIFYGNSMAMLERIGALAAVEAIGAPRITFYGTRLPSIGLDLVARLPPSGGRDYAYSIRRERLDAAIYDVVAALPGVTVRQGFDVRGLAWGAGRVVGVRGRQGGGPEQTIYARGVIGADGKRSVVARHAAAPVYASARGRTAIFYAYYSGVAPLADPSAVVYGHPDRKTGILVFDADDGLAVVSVGVPAEQFAAARRDPEGAMARAWSAIPELAARLARAERATPVMGQGPLDSYFRQSYGAGWALVGDAGHYIDPVTGQGINNALRSAELVAEAWARTRRRSDWLGAMAAYQRHRDAYARPIYDMVAMGEQFEGLARAGLDLGPLFLKAIARSPELSSRYIGIFNGATPVAAFFHPLSMARLLVEDQLRHELPQRALSGFVAPALAARPG
ncbi:MAG TPA: FAD-dependent monooxygenase, partial [Chloroflexaceae bacterium]|nr:FAD-dependent monooxygenase [Chloroflexaceae bacterium]